MHPAEIANQGIGLFPLLSSSTDYIPGIAGVKQNTLTRRRACRHWNIRVQAIDAAGILDAIGASAADQNKLIVSRFQIMNWA
jgi:hypothetical protein